MVFYDVETGVLPTRFESVNLSLAVMFAFVSNLFNKTLLVDLLKTGSIKSKFGFLYKLYLLAFIRVVDPDVVVTFIDNNSFFHWLSRKYKKAKFYAIQNGLRNEMSVSDYLPPRPHSASIISIPNFFCFGSYEKDLYNKYGHDIGAFLPCGSLRASYYKSSDVFKRYPNDRFDICLVSEWEYSLFYKGLFPHIRKSLDVLNSYLSSYLLGKDLKVCVALRTNSKLEKEFYTKIYGDKLVLVDYNPGTFSTYSCMDRSDVVVNCFSTCGVEALGWNKKVLFCNFSGNHKFDIDQTPWFIKIENYELFKEMIDKLIGMGEGDYVKSTKDCAKYLMDYSNGPTHEYIRNVIYSELKN